jgi:hypothetical protein
MIRDPLRPARGILTGILVGLLLSISLWALIGDMQRDPLPAGHSATWTALTAGTVLAGEAYSP